MSFCRDRKEKDFKKFFDDGNKKDEELVEKINNEKKWDVTWKKEVSETSDDEDSKPTHFNLL